MLAGIALNLACATQFVYVKAYLSELLAGQVVPINIVLGLQYNQRIEPTSNTLGPKVWTQLSLATSAS